VPVYELRAEVWVHPGKGGWHFVTLPAELADEIRARHGRDHRAFGSLRVRASIGSSTWSTSLFADAKSSSYALPIKADVRRREQLEPGDVATVRLDVDG
jgi:hypothetical protein